MLHGLASVLFRVVENLTIGLDMLKATTRPNTDASGSKKDLSSSALMDLLATDPASVYRTCFV